jgi:hypothetical protein
LLPQRRWQMLAVAGHCWVQAPPRQPRMQVAPSAQAWVQPPPAQVKLQLPFLPQLCWQ